MIINDVMHCYCVGNFVSTLYILLYGVQPLGGGVVKREGGREFKEKLNQLILINRSIASGELEVLYADEDEYIAARKGEGENPGLVLYINTNGLELNRQVKTHWIEADLHDYTGGITSSVSTDSSGETTLKAPANGYAVWSIK